MLEELELLEVEDLLLVEVEPELLELLLLPDVVEPLLTVVEFWLELLLPRLT